ncbi:MAG: ATP-binding protein [Halobacteriaceae archaeon]
MPRDELSAPGAEDRFEYLIDHLQDAVVEFDIEDGEPIVRSVNPAFVEVFGYEPAEIVGQELNDFIVPSWLVEQAETLDERTAAGEVNYRRVRRETTDGLREFLYRGIPYESADGSRAGFAVYTDLTDRSRRERRLEVTSRVLRHNLRNRVTVLDGAAGKLRREVDDPDPAVRQELARIEDAISSLETLSEEASEIHRLLDEAAETSPAVDCAALVRDVVATFRTDHPEATIETDLPESLTVAATERLGSAVAALIENAIEHNPAPSPWLRVSASSVSDDWVDLVVADDAPPIPAMERDIVTGDRRISQTYHGSGLGLWLAAWTAERFGGDLAFGESDAGGNRVRIRLQRASA